MDEYRTQRYDSPKGEPDYEWEYEEAPPPPNILWGRVAVLLAGLIFAFAIGRASAPDPPEDTGEEVEAVRAELNASEEEVARLQDEIEAMQQDLAEAEETQTEETTQTAGEDETDTSNAQTYTVQAGDSLSSIAEEFYGDMGKAQFLADVNDIEDPTQLYVGQELLIPELEEAEASETEEAATE